MVVTTCLAEMIFLPSAGRGGRHRIRRQMPGVVARRIRRRSTDSYTAVEIREAGGRVLGGNGRFAELRPGCEWPFRPGPPLSAAKGAAVPSVMILVDDP